MKYRSSLKWVCEVGELGWVGLSETATDFRLLGTNKIELICTYRVHTALLEPTQHGLSGGWMDGWGDWNKCTSAVKLPLSEVMKSRAGFCGVVGGLAIHRIGEWRALGTTATYWWRRLWCWWIECSERERICAIRFRTRPPNLLLHFLHNLCLRSRLPDSLESHHHHHHFHL